MTRTHSWALSGASHPHTSMTMQDEYRNARIEKALCIKGKMKEYSVILMVSS